MQVSPQQNDNTDNDDVQQSLSFSQPPASTATTNTTTTGSSSVTSSSRRSTATTSTSSWASSFLSRKGISHLGRISKPLIRDFYILLDEPHRVWYPGSVIQGKVVLDLAKDTSVAYVKLSFKGSIILNNVVAYVSSYKHSLLQETLTLWGDNKNASSQSLALPAGEHQFRFALQVPVKNVFTSVEFERGSISYHLSACVKRLGGHRELKCWKTITAEVPVDVSKLPAPKPSVMTVEVVRGRDKGLITITSEIGCSGVLKGELIPVRVTVKHVTPIKSVKGIIITFARLTRLMTGKSVQLFRKDLSQGTFPLYIDPQTLTAVTNANVSIPPETFPTVKGCSLVTFRYILEVLVDLAGGLEVETTDSSLTPAPTGLVNPDIIRRKHGVAATTLDIIIGTERSKPAPKKLSIPREPRPHRTRSSASYDIEHPPIPGMEGNYFAHYQATAGRGNMTPVARVHSGSYNQSVNIPQAQSAMSEKQRLHEMEQSLLPSAPPGAMDQDIIGSAPPLEDLEQEQIDTTLGVRVSSEIGAPSSPYCEYLPQFSDDGPPPPLEDDPTNGSTIDKLEAERIRLQQMASEPTYDNNVSSSYGAGTSRENYVPSSAEYIINGPLEPAFVPGEEDFLYDDNYNNNRIGEQGPQIYINDVYSERRQEQDDAQTATNHLDTNSSMAAVNNSNKNNNNNNGDEDDADDLYEPIKAGPSPHHI